MRLPYSLFFYFAILAAAISFCTQPFTQGKRLYEANCSRCHGMDGHGFEDLYPGITESPFVSESRKELACIIAYGSTYLDATQGNNTEIKMPANGHLSAVEVLNIMNFISWQFGDQQPFKIENIMNTLEACIP